MAQRRARHEAVLHAVRNAPVILALRHLIRVLVEVLAADPMMDAVLSAAESAEIALCLIDVGSIVSHVFLTMVDPARVIGRVQPLPGVRFVGMNDRARRDVLA